MLEGFSTQLGPVLEVFAEMGNDERELFLELLRIALEGTVSMDPTDERHRRTEIRKVFAAAGLEESASLAENVAVIGDAELARRILPLAASGKHAALLAAFCALAQSIKSGRIIESAVDQASRVIKALRLFSHRANAKEVKEVDIRNEIEEILTIFRNKLKHGVELSTRFAADSIVLGRSDELTQVWTNLINNALQAMNYRGRLELITEERGDMLAVSVGDTGTGIPKEVQDRIFEPFFTTKDSGEGTGLGLDIARRVVEGHGGTIDFESERGHTVFTVLLPRRRDVSN
jgi:signal transduction histidine kinase